MWGTTKEAMLLPLAGWQGLKCGKSANMGNLSRTAIDIPSQQKAIRDRCFHPSGLFAEFQRAEIALKYDKLYRKIARDKWASTKYTSESGAEAASKRWTSGNGDEQ